MSHARHRLEELAREVAGAAGAAGAEVELAGAGTSRSAMNSATVFAGTAGFTTRTFGVEATWVTGDEVLHRRRRECSGRASG